MIPFTTKVRISNIRNNRNKDDKDSCKCNSRRPSFFRNENSSKLDDLEEKGKITIKNGTNLKTRLYENERKQTNKQFFSEVGISSKILERTKFTSQRTKSKAQFISKGSPFVFHESRARKTVTHEALDDKVLPFSTSYVNNLNEIFSKNEEYHQKTQQTQNTIWNSKISNTHVTYKKNPSTKPRRSYNSITNSLPAEILCNKKLQDINQSQNFNGAENSLYRNPKKNNSIICHNDTKEHGSSFNAQYQLKFNYKKNASLTEYKNLHAILHRDINKERKESLSMDKNKFVLGQKKSCAKELMEEGRYRESHDIFWHVLQKEKEFMYLHPSSTVHLEMAESYFCIGLLLDLIGDQKISLIYLNESLEIRKQNLRSDDLAIAWALYYSGYVKGKMGDITGAISDLNTCSSIQMSNRVHYVDTSVLLKEYRQLLRNALAA